MNNDTTCYTKTNYLNTNTEQMNTIGFDVKFKWWHQDPINILEIYGQKYCM